MRNTSRNFARAVLASSIVFVGFSAQVTAADAATAPAPNPLGWLFPGPKPAPAPAPTPAPAPKPTPAPKPKPQPKPKPTRAEKVIKWAAKEKGKPYQYGADGPGSFDCSGLMKYSYQKAGITLPRTASAQSKRAHRIPKNKLRRGDLMFFTNGGGVYHAAMFLRWNHGRAVMVHSPGSGQHVRRDHPWTKRWFAGTMRG
jgi:cell wall-associated NlpC family hydrolase